MTLEPPHVESDSAQNATQSKPSKPVPNGYKPPSPAEPSLILLLCLISGAVPQDERASLIEAIFVSRDAYDTVRRLRGSDAQTFVDVVDETSESPSLAPGIRRNCLKSLYETCAGHTILPRSLQIELPDGPTGVPLCRGGFGDVWKREYRGKEVAVKVLKRYANSDLRRITRRFCKEFVTWRSLRHPNVLPLLGVIMSETWQFAMVSDWMSNGNINEFVKVHSDANRFELLADVARGLIFMHGQRMVHGDLKGANILINETGRACLADFGLLAIISAGTSYGSSSSLTQGGTFRWMSPELFYPKEFGLKDSRPTKHSDCYALGMVIYEVLSGQVPFHRYNFFTVVKKVSGGERPKQPRGPEREWFMNDVWRILEHCWMPKPDDRPSVEGVLRCLEGISGFWTPLSQVVTNLPTTNPLAQNSSDPDTEGSTEESETSSLSQPLQTLPPKASLHEVTNNQDFGVYVKNPSKSDPGEPVAVQDRTPQPNLNLNARRSGGRLFVSDMVGIYDKKKVGVEALEPHDLAPKGIAEETFSRDVAESGARRRDVVHPPGTLFQIIFEWTRNQKAASWNSITFD